MQKKIDQAARWIRSSRKTVALTGAGVSTESGIPDFRSPGGIWTRFDPAEYAAFSSFRADPVKVWDMFYAMEELLDTQPNAGHIALAELEAAGALAGIATQNIDGLHQAAGSKTVVEFHGSHKSYTCIKCGKNYLRAELETLGRPPRCSQSVRGEICRQVLKPNVVMFEEQIPQDAMNAAIELVDGADLVLVIGTSCQVYPFAALPHQARKRGARIIQIDLFSAPSLEADLALAGKFSVLITAVLEAYKGQSMELQA